jgi:hypothetical protein
MECVGRRRRDRTSDLGLVGAALSQLSYPPVTINFWRNYFSITGGDDTLTDFFSYPKLSPMPRSLAHCPAFGRPIIAALSIVFAACATGEVDPDVNRALTFEERCAQPGVVKCFGFDSQEETDPFIYPPYGMTTKRARVVTDIKSSGAGSLRFEIPTNTGSDTSGSFWQNFSDDLSVQFGEGEEFYVQWRQRFSPEFLNTFYESGGGWKQVIIGEGDRPGKWVASCTQLEVVVQDTEQRGAPEMYHSCGGKDGGYEGLDRQVRWMRYRADQWMTFQVSVKIGTWYQNDGKYHEDSRIRLWVAEAGRPSKLAVNQTHYDIANNDRAARYGKIWLLPYHSRKSPAQRHPTAYTWYDELIISKFRIADPSE